ncbi:hypothetical protein DRQ33_04755 [bacterium]|nr:MAG: hypothetical protein DRQ33_04755 [bacterium]
MTFHKMKMIMVLFSIVSYCWGDEITPDAIFEHLAEFGELACSLDIREQTLLDTFSYTGFLALRPDKFYAHLGGDYYLQTDTAEILSWTDGSDAIPIPGLPFFDLSRLYQELTKRFSLRAEKNTSGYCIIGNSSDTAQTVKHWEFCTDKEYVPIKLEILYYQGNKVGISFYSIGLDDNANLADSIFTLPDGVRTIR